MRRLRVDLEADENMYERLYIEIHPSIYEEERKKIIERADTEIVINITGDDDEEEDTTTIYI